MRNQHATEEIASEISVSMQEGQLHRQTDTCSPDQVERLTLFGTV